MMNKKQVLKKIITISVALLLYVSAANDSLISKVSADSVAPTTELASKKVKPFNVAVIKKNYGVYQGLFENKKSSAKYFHQNFVVSHVSTHNGKKYYWISKKNQPAIGYINQNAVAKPNQSKLIKVPYVSQYVPVKTPWGCAGASMAMLLGSQGQEITTSLLQKIQDNLPMQPIKGGQKGNVYTGVGFGYVIQPGALSKYARTFDKGKNVINISKKNLTLNDIKMYLQAGKPVLFYGFSSYQKPGDYVRNHCKVITGYRHGDFRVYDPLYYSRNDGAGSGGKNMAYDHGAIAWVPKAALQNEFCHKAITLK
ncbi:Uncharacterized protein YvpB [Lactobacillus bombicola]|uniref:Uncharacterized protein YvpB n=1 Tax=Lactobacillus bombicola TaxID=1505723 RepID=A0A1I1TJP4_9LACO|nr:C39 family peptidase [Lactobacillus bombicola]MCO6528430.1 C39 family peptidase [Lactobacillus sp.]SFD55700.1 Uncharacterized protein YvpB [Lactobacillus bombicola]